ncbi:hypothetical protein Patl1_36164 [Pistacia atlantica]|nr:hypothetical protein Patl1_36164 [Pistacia atlantica]
MEELAHDFSPFIRVYKDGRVERLMGTEILPPSSNGTVESKDVVFSPETGLSAGLFAPKIRNPDQKLPLLVYIHGGCFCFGTPFSATYHNYLNALVHEANIIAVSVDYRRAPEHPVYFAGDSSGANTAHFMGLRCGQEKPEGVKVAGIILIHPYFWGSEPIGAEVNHLERREFVEKFWRFVCPATSGCDDPLFNPVADPKLASLESCRVLVCVTEKDLYRDRGWFYYEKLKESEWRGVVEIIETKGEDHVFHLFNPSSENAVALLKQIGFFINQKIQGKA